MVKDSKIPYLVSAHTGHMYPTKRYDNEEQRLEQAMRHVKVMNKMMGSVTDTAGTISAFDRMEAKADAMLEKYTKIADETFDSVLGRLK